ncbi:alpha-hydroxy acid oxidase [Oryzicola mucosus]|uniref:Alpha-hydroxy-acid oxidizing protein n=1 Tax=Oryzicola mucosus TaxID=2767425 RepID=A0A8J6U9K4_9HYPH|nr:alpha-hydroxy acid oxidase [Oryzicola mucosus]MBD0417462.1 alpha-hydroxy-acid oxidizing protein [Oryzicola mucosus]
MTDTGRTNILTGIPDQVVVAARPPSRADPRLARRFLNLDDFQGAAKRRLPRQIYGYYAGAAETEQSLRDNRGSFQELALIPRVLADVSRRTTAKSLFGRDYRLPIGIAPMGLSGLSTYQGDLVLAQSALAENIPMIVSATSIMPLERLAREGGADWFQAYLPGEPERIDAMVDRVALAGFSTLVLTADVPVPANRENNERTGFSIPLRPSLRLFVDGLMRPSWSVGTFLRTLSDAAPRFENMDAFRGPPVFSRNLVRQIGARDQLSWSHAARIRDRWQGKLVVKGLLSAADAAKAREIGADGIIVSNHGGRQLDGAIAPLRVLPEIVKESGSMQVMIDGGVRRGTDVLKALAAGADFVFIGRPFLMSAVFGKSAVRHAISIMAEEIGRDMALLGINSLDQLDASFIRKIK